MKESKCKHGCFLWHIGQMQGYALVLMFVIGVTAPVHTGLAQEQNTDQSEASKDVHKHERPNPPRRLDAHRITDEHRSPNGFEKQWWEWGHATGDWLGARPWLDEHGITFEISYSANYFYNLRGGLNTSHAGEYRGLLGLGLTLDTDKLGLWENGTAFVSMLENHGRDITELHVGDLQALNNADAPNRTRLYEFWYEHSFGDGALRLKLGKMDANVDFAATDFGGEFIHSSSGFSPTIPLPTWPDPALGIAVFIEPVEWLYLGAGVYDALSSGTRGGFDTAFHSPDDSFAICELGLRSQLGMFGQKDLPGTYRVGGFYHSGEWDVYFNDLDGRLKPRTHRGNSGLYLVFDQLLYREPQAVEVTAENLVPGRFADQPAEDEENEQGLGLFFQFSCVPLGYNEITRHYGGGLHYLGLMPGRDDDVTGLAIHHVSLSGEVQSLENRHSETAIELLHKFQLTEFMSIKPELQYIVNPGGAGPDAIVAGMRLEMSF